MMLRNGNQDVHPLADWRPEMGINKEECSWRWEKNTLS